MSENRTGLCSAFVEIANLALRMGAAPLNQKTGCWEIAVDPLWWIAVNPHSRPIACSHGPVVSAFTCYVEFNGWPAGVITPAGGTFVAGTLANEATFIEALQRRVA